MFRCRINENKFHPQLQNELPIKSFKLQKSVSVDSLDEETDILNQVILEGTRTFTSHQPHYINNPNDSCSSNDSCDEQQNRSLLEQTVQSGISKVTNTNQLSAVACSTNDHFKSSNKIYKHEHLSNEQLLEEAINTGISKTIGKVQRTEPSQLLSTSKNVRNPTSVMLMDNTDVGKEINAFENAVFQHQQQHRVAEQRHSTNRSKLSVSTDSAHSLMCRSNESALKMSAYDFLENSYTDLHMEISNEFMIEKGTLADKNGLTDFDKRKNPDLMVASVDRLTQQLVATAEYLRQTDINCLREQRNSSSTSTWNEDSVSFPTTSVDAPKIYQTGFENEEQSKLNGFTSTFEQQKTLKELPSKNENLKLIKKVLCEKGAKNCNTMSQQTSLCYDETDTFKSIETIKYDSQYNGK